MPRIKYDDARGGRKVRPPRGQPAIVFLAHTVARVFRSHRRLSQKRRIDGRKIARPPIETLLKYCTDVYVNNVSNMRYGGADGFLEIFKENVQ